MANSNHLLCSALEIEQVLLDHPEVRECAVIGVPNDVYGERVGAIIVPKNTKQVNGMSLSLGIGCGRTTVTKLCCGTHQMITSSCQQTREGEVVPALVTCTSACVPDWRYVVVLYADTKSAATQMGSLSLSSVRDHCQEHLARYKLPQHVWTVEELPRNAMGKVNKKQLAKQFLEHHQY